MGKQGLAIKRGLAIFALMGLLVFNSALDVAAHGGEDHGDAPQVVVVNAQTNVKVAKTSTAEILVEYVTPQPTAEVPFRIFISDLKTNAPLTEVSVSLTISALAKNVVAPATVAARPIAPGIYQAMLSFATAGPHNLALKLRGNGIDAQTTVTGIIVVQPEVTLKPSIMQQLPAAWIWATSVVGLVYY
jgi:hypothetical protein